MKDYFSEQLEEEPWSDVEATLCYAVQRIPLFKEKRMMVKLKNIHDDRETGEFEFKVFLTERPEVYPSWDESDDEEGPVPVFFCMKVKIKVESIDSLKMSSGLVLASDNLLFEEKPMPKTLLSYVKNLASRDMC